MGPQMSWTARFAVNLRHYYVNQPVTRVPNGAYDESQAMSLGVS